MNATDNILIAIQAFSLCLLQLQTHKNSSPFAKGVFIAPLVCISLLFALSPLNAPIPFFLQQIVFGFMLLYYAQHYGLLKSRKTLTLTNKLTLSILPGFCLSTCQPPATISVLAASTLLLLFSKYAKNTLQDIHSLAMLIPLFISLYWLAEPEISKAFALQKPVSTISWQQVSGSASLGVMLAVVILVLAGYFIASKTHNNHE